MVFYHKGLRVRKTPLPFVACARKAAILHVQIWSEHESDVVGLCGTHRKRHYPKSLQPTTLIMGYLVILSGKDLYTLTMYYSFMNSRIESIVISKLKN